MFFIMGVSQGRKKLNFDQMIVCNNCGKYGHLDRAGAGGALPDYFP